MVMLNAGRYRDGHRMPEKLDQDPDKTVLLVDFLFAAIPAETCGHGQKTARRINVPRIDHAADLDHTLSFLVQVEVCPHRYLDMGCVVPLVMVARSVQKSASAEQARRTSSSSVRDSQNV
jgi:hypothetical protein